MKKKTKIIILLLGLIIGSVILTVKLFNIENNTLEVGSTKVEENANENSINTNTEEYTNLNNTINEENQEDKIIVDNNETNNSLENDKKEEIKEETQTKEEKAVSIVENIWKNEKEVYCYFEEIDSEGNYIVCVRDKETTRALYWYKVNIETGIATIK